MAVPIITLPDILAGAVAAVLALLAISLAARGSAERGVYVLAWIFKLIMAAGYLAVLLGYYGGGDTVFYQNSGGEFASLLGRVGLPAYLATYLGPSGTNTSHMVALTGLMNATTGGSFVASSVLYALLGFAGQVLLYRTLTAEYPDPRLRRLWQAGILFFPSLTFWSAGMVKDTLGILGLGLILWGAQGLRRGRLQLLAAALAGSYVIYLFRAEMLPIVLVALLPWLLAATEGRVPGGRKLLRFALILAVPAGIFLFLQAYPRYALSNLPAQLVAQGQVYQQAPVTTDGSWTGILLAWPSTIVLALFRPFPWEAHGLTGLVAAAENVALLGLTVRAVRGVMDDRRIAVTALRAPLFQVCLIFILAFALGVGVTTPNLGSVNRYRIPIIPFTIGALVILEGLRLPERAHPRPAVTRAAAAVSNST